MSFDLVFFGGTGDLTWRKLMPALFQAWRHGKLPEGGRILSVARDERSDDDYRQFIRERFVEVDSAKRPSDEEFARFAALLHYRRMDLSLPEHYAGLKEWVTARNADTVVLFLATSPHLFPQICDQLGKVGLNGPNVRVVLEKPLGHDLASAREINRVVRGAFREDQALRIDHYLGKPAVQNLMALRFGNALFEPLWRRESIANIQITLAESLGVGTRGDFYDRTGALRDMIQNHALQLLTMVAMEPPSSNDADAIRDEKLKVLRSLRRINGNEAPKLTVRGQYRAGASAGGAVKGYQDELGTQSSTETFVAIKAEIENWRWAGVPFYLRTGKRLATRVSEIVIEFKHIPHSIFGENAGRILANQLVIRLQPDEGVKQWIMIKDPGPGGMRLRNIALDMSFAQSFQERNPDAYERLVMDVVRGNQTLFMRRDEVEAAWKWIDPIQGAWADNLQEAQGYTAGTWGPSSAIALIERDGRTWHEST